MIIEKFLLPLQPFVVKLNALAAGVSHYNWTADASFFGNFGNPDILDADIKVSLTLHNHGVTVDAECVIEGAVTVQCDRCLEDLEIPVETSFEETYVPEGEDLDFGQDVYDFVCIALPIQRVHEEGGCNEETVKYLSEEKEEDK